MRRTLTLPARPPVAERAKATPSARRSGPSPRPARPGTGAPPSPRSPLPQASVSPPVRRPTVAPVPAAAAGTSTATRLNKRMAELGLCSRREADAWIEAGWVRVNGQTVGLGHTVHADDRIEVDPAARQAQATQVTVLLHKPVGYVSGLPEDGHPSAAVLIVPANRWRDDRSRRRFEGAHTRGLAPAGRLDIDSTGLLVMTQDGRVAKALIGEHSGVEKEYLVRVQWAPAGPKGPGVVAQEVQQVFPAERLALLRHGLQLDGQALRPAQVDWQNPEQLRFVLREGRKRQIRRMCEQVGLHVVGLKRVRIGAVRLGQLPPGQWRYLLPDEVF